jgi:hypothetical protein
MVALDIAWLMLVSFAGFALAPFWATCWDRALRRAGLSRRPRVMGVLALSIATLLVTFVGPWVLLAVVHGALAADPAEPGFPVGMLFLFGPGVVIQAFWALSVAMRCDRTSN